MRRETNWNWASLSTMDDRGRQIGFNAAAGMNETSFTENGVWVDGRLHLMHAPLVGKSVEISELPLAERILDIEAQDGIMVARPR